MHILWNRLAILRVDNGAGHYLAFIVLSCALNNVNASNRDDNVIIDYILFLTMVPNLHSFSSVSESERASFQSEHELS